MSSCLVVGSTGLVGTLLVKELVLSDDFDLVVALVRETQFTNTGKLTEVKIDFNDPKALGNLQSVDHIFCCLGTTIRKAGSKEAFRYVDYELPVSFARWAEQTKAESFSIVTALGADSASKIFYNQIKGEVEDKIKEFNIPKIQIFQPSLILGKRIEFRVGELIGKAIFKTINPLFFGPLSKYRGIEAIAIARGMITYLKNSTNGINIIESNSISKYDNKIIQ